jgi:hypothetical protein
MSKFVFWGLIIGLLIVVTFALGYWDASFDRRITALEESKTMTARVEYLKSIPPIMFMSLKSATPPHDPIIKYDSNGTLHESFDGGHTWYKSKEVVADSAKALWIQIDKKPHRLPVNRPVIKQDSMIHLPNPNDIIQFICNPQGVSYALYSSNEGRTWSKITPDNPYYKWVLQAMRAK